jgi:catechol 2,3-dioxygenase-like lactoylglutathione lyase family enzyme
VITGVHALVFSKDAEAVRAFLRDVLGLPSVDAGGGWLIFALPPAELAAHPAEQSGAHELYLMCDDIAATVEELKAKGVEFATPVTEQGFGLMTRLKLRGGGELGLYEPRHPTAI